MSMRGDFGMATPFRGDSRAQREAVDRANAAVNRYLAAEHDQNDYARFASVADMLRIFKVIRPGVYNRKCTAARARICDVVRKEICRATGGEAQSGDIEALANLVNAPTCEGLFLTGKYDAILGRPKHP
jgi:hypothetical protein